MLQPTSDFNLENRDDGKEIKTERENLFDKFMTNTLASYVSEYGYKPLEEIKKEANFVNIYAIEVFRQRQYMNQTEFIEMDSDWIGYFFNRKTVTVCNEFMKHNKKILSENKFAANNINLNMENDKQCIKCSKQFDNESEYWQHRLKEIDYDKTCFCPFCIYISESKTIFMCHLEYHFSIDNYNCPICDFVGNSKMHLSCHFREHGGNEDCNICRQNNGICKHNPKILIKDNGNVQLTQDYKNANNIFENDTIMAKLLMQVWNTMKKIVKDKYKESKYICAYTLSRLYLVATFSVFEKNSIESKLEIENEKNKYLDIVTQLKLQENNLEETHDSNTEIELIRMKNYFEKKSTSCIDCNYKSSNVVEFVIHIIENHSQTQSQLITEIGGLNVDITNGCVGLNFNA
ncbi:hypothetical protein A3Q56_00569 [Intoshia linei]|uniref:C2H2-type domain-containing protein n=1 Tax=Intoshia linei TaxID=1819745 RepID=A0A177BDH0_9BILA|nr:hypothetical protein A3Q56_00569 [Intoshia linei]